MTEQQSSAVAVREQSAIERVRVAVESRIGDIASILPPSMDAARFVRVSLMAVSKNPGLLECDRASIVMSIIEAAEVGLEPTGGVGGAHLVPFRDKQGNKHAQLIYDYRGLQYLIREGGGGEVKTVLVYEGDIFKVYQGTERPRIHHTPRFQTEDPAKVTYVYAVPLDHPEKFEVMSRTQVEAVRARSKAANNGPWVTDWGPQARKTVLKRIAAWLPLKPSARQAIDNDTQRELSWNADDDSGEPVRSRTTEVRDRIRANSGRRRGRQDQQEAPGAPEAAPPPDVSAPDDSAAQRTEDAATDDAGVVEGDSREVCGANGTGVAEGEVCSLAPDHPEKVHKSASASWPVE